MVELLEKAFAEISKLSEEQQTAFAQWILEELESEDHWTKLFADSQDKLSFLAEKALADYRQGLTKELDPDNLE